MNEPLLRIEKIDKSYFGVKVLQQVSIDAHAGQTLGLIGENGAGKSTLMNILGGVVPADSGSITFDGFAHCPRSPRDAERSGVAFIHQELNLFPNLSIAENLFLTSFPGRWGWIQRRQTHQLARELLRRVGSTLSPSMQVDRLSAGERQLVEIAKALNHRSRLIIFDEPTTSLSETETTRLFDLIESLRRDGIAMVYVSHALGDVQRLCDRIAILRDGRVVGEGAVTEFDTNRMVRLMVGRQVDQLYPTSTRQPDREVLLEVRGLSQPGVVHEIDLTLHRGEVLGIAGLMGSGRTELARILFGLDEFTDGQIELNGRSLGRMPVHRRIAAGMAMLTESRRDDGLFLADSIDANLGVVAAPKYKSAIGGLLKKSQLNEAIKAISEAVNLKGGVDRSQSVVTLSGGNQQKVVLGKWLLNEPKVLILDEPTRGIDVGAKYEIYSLIDRLAARGAGVLVISSEIDELIGICDRILVMSQGEIRDQMKREAFDRERILHAALHANLISGEQS